MRKFVLSIFLLIPMTYLSGCVVGQKISYNDTELNLKASGTKSIAIAAIENRSYVNSGEKDRDYVGKFRAGFGNPWNVSTVSGKSLTVDMTTVVCSAFKKKDISCISLTVDPKETKEQVIHKLTTTKADNLFMFIVNEWLSDTYMNTGLSYDVDLLVLDSLGGKLAESRVKGDDELGGSFFDPPTHAKQAVPLAYREKLETLLNDVSILKVMK